MEQIVIIPARYASERLPGKPLIDICGKPMLQRVYEQAIQSNVDRVIIATDNKAIEDAMTTLGFEVCITCESHRSGTDRLSEVIAKLKIDNNAVIINVQGDEPLIPPETIDQVSNSLIENSKAVMSTLSTPIESMETLNDPNVVKVVSNKKGEALYFSRSVIPFNRASNEEQDLIPVELYQRHVGIYAYRAKFIQQFSQWPVCKLESLESLEQLRVLWHGETIQVAQAILKPAEGVDTMADLAKVRQIVQNLEPSL